MHSADRNGISVDFVAPSTTSASIVFASNDSPCDNQGALIDNVVVTDNTTVPEPGSAALLLAGALAWAIRRRNLR